MPSEAERVVFGAATFFESETKTGAKRSESSKYRICTKQ